ncbi:hypothetical protein GIB67_028221 [Kingdonia uniflora]|uniref:DNL-type domain-containing protein n=1 Tax=Kingdonia uniflora TaxID=39325 RepID=A0A7J7KZ45_9MAGN|nr:hypothetical protein GIB67_028221 [Kingdonia uniflora]
MNDDESDAELDYDYVYFDDDIDEMTDGDDNFINVRNEANADALKNENESDLRSESNSNNHLSFSHLSKDAAMGLVLSAATGRGWTTGSGMEGPSIPADTGTENISTFPWSLFTKSPRRRMLVAFTCKICSQRTTRAINPHAYNDGTVFVQCCGCNVFHKLVDNLNLFDEMKCYVLPSFNYNDPKGGVSFKYLDMDGDDDNDDVFPIL